MVGKGSLLGVLTLLIVSMLAGPVSAEDGLDKVCRDHPELNPACNALGVVCRAAGGQAGFSAKLPFLGPGPLYVGRGDIRDGYGSFYYIGHYSWPDGGVRHTYWFDGQIKVGSDGDCNRGPMPPPVRVGNTQTEIF